MGKTLYLECNSGISGDMVVAALLDLGASEDKMRTVLASLPLTGFRVEVCRVKKNGLDCCDFNVILDEDMENHDHDMAYLYGHLENEDPGNSHGHDHSHGHNHSHEQGQVQEHSYGHDHSHEHEHSHDHGHNHNHIHDHSHGHDHSHHVHRGMKEVMAIISAASMTEGARVLAGRIFGIIAEAEAQAHGTTADKVHFHEVGAVDSIVDIVAAAVCLDDLQITDTVITGISEGSGTVRCAHGILSVPVPAVAAISKDHQLPIRMTGRQGELITPTGAAIAAAICTSHNLPDPLIITGSGMGAGKRAYEIPSILRAFLLKEEETGLRNGEEGREDRVWKLETNVDDCSGEDLGYVMEELFKAGARDVFYSPIYMKKNRPGILLSVLCMEEDVGRLEQIIFQETTTIGIRRCPYERTILPRKKGLVQTDWGEVEVKICTLPDGRERVYPEYESVSGLARTRGVSRREILEKL